MFLRTICNTVANYITNENNFQNNFSIELRIKDKLKIRMENFLILILKKFTNTYIIWAYNNFAKKKK